MADAKHTPGPTGWSAVQWSSIVLDAKAERRYRSAHRQIPGAPRSSWPLTVANDCAREVRKYARAAIAKATGSTNHG